MSYSAEQLRAVASILELPVKRNKADLVDSITRALRKGHPPHQKSHVGRSKSKSKSRKSKSHSRKKTKTANPRSAAKRKSNSRKARKSTSKKVVKLSEVEFNREAYRAAVARMADQGYTELVSALWCCHGDKANKLWILLRKPGTTAPNERVTIWGGAQQSPRHNYGGVAISDRDFVDSKYAKGYVKHGSLKRLVQKVLSK